MWSRISALALLSALLGGCQEPPPPVPRVLIVGIDGASPRVVDAMLANGRLKNLRFLAERGAYGPLKSEVPPLSPRVWTTMATGKVPDKHGIYGWVKFSKDASTSLFYSTDRNGAALWDILSDAGKSVAVVNWLITYPPTKINGVMISDHALARAVVGKQYLGEIFAKAQGQELDEVKSSRNSAPAVYPPEWEPRALAPGHTRAVLTKVANPFRDTGPDDGFRSLRSNLLEFWETDERLTSMTLEVIAKKKPDVTMLLLQGIDRASHFLFGCLDSPETYPATFQPTTEQRLNCQRALYDFYEFTDQLIGRLLAAFDDDDLVMVVSDHGFEALYEEFRTGGHASAQASYGVWLAHGPRVRRNGPVAAMSVADLTPTVLDWYGLPLAKDMDGKPAPFLEQPPTPVPESIDTYDTIEIEHVSETESGGETAVKDQLRSLGYLE